MEVNFRRAVAFLIDHFFICLLGIMAMAVVTLGRLDITPLSLITFFCVAILVLLFRDKVFGNASIGKKVMKLKVVVLSGQGLTISVLLKRTLPIILLLFPLEMVLVLTCNKRLGDMWAGTEVVLA